MTFRSQKLFFALALVSAHLIAQSASIPLTQEGRSASVIVHPDNCALSARTAQKLSNYIRQQTDVAVPVVSERDFKKPGRGTTVILLDGTRGHRLADQFKQRIEITSERNDAYHLKTVSSRSTSPLVLLAGNTPEGAKFAAYRLIREMEIENGNAFIKPLNVKAAPFIKTRSVSLFNVWQMPIDLTRRHNTESWPMERLERYIDMFDFYGFNAIETHDRFNDNYLQPLFGLERAEWKNKVLRMTERAHDNGQKVLMRIWGHSVMETPKFDKPLGPTASVPKKLVNFCVNDPEQRARWENEILKYYVTNYAGRIDNLIGHWVDPGVCRKNGCDYKTPMRLHMELHNAFKAVDPDFESSFSTWFFDVTKDSKASWAHGGWEGYESDFDLLNAGILSNEVIFTTATMRPGSYKDDVVKASIAKGQRPAIWTWYRADHEIRPSLHIHLHERVESYFRGLPQSAKQLEWHSIERNVHAAANTANYYVAARLMWDPSEDANDVLKEFLAKVFGKENAKKIFPAYAAIENIRCHSCWENWEQVRTTGMGTESPKADLKAARNALTKLAEVKIDPEFRPRVPLDVSPEQIIADLKASLEVIRDYANFRANELPVAENLAEKSNRQPAEKFLDEMYSKYKSWSLTLAGRQEWSLVDREIKRLRKRLNDEKSR